MKDLMGYQVTVRVGGSPPVASFIQHTVWTHRAHRHSFHWKMLLLLLLFLPLLGVTHSLRPGPMRRHAVGLCTVAGEALLGGANDLLDQ